jgi:tRNA-splicing ligase RtcB
MARLGLKGKDIAAIGFKEGVVISMALEVLKKHYKHKDEPLQKQDLKALLANPQDFVEDEVWGGVAHKMLDIIAKGESVRKEEIALRQNPISYHIYGAPEIEYGALAQMEVAAKLPVSLAGALMPDAHQGYGLPIGGVLATHQAIIPYAVGVDIGCRMALSIFELTPAYLESHRSLLKQYLLSETKFGTGGELKKPLDDAIFERKEFSEIPLVKQLKDKAARQIGSSGSGNHFVEFGVVEVSEFYPEMGIAPGLYIGLLSHSGSRGLGATIANHYTALARKSCLLPKQAQHLAWLDMNKEEGQEYWLAMNLAGDYASACHAHIHRKLAKQLGVTPLVVVENHHNFAWKEIWEGREAIVHRKGATPATKGVLGIIPGSMASQGFIVRGKGNPLSLSSASHGAGRLMSRKAATEQFTKKMMTELLTRHRVELIGGAIDESPMAYKDIHKVMNYQNDLVDIIGTFTPKIVRMDG